MGRPLKPIDAEQVEKLARIGCTQDEIADVLGCSQGLISQRFLMEYTRGRASLKTSLRRAQAIRAIRDRSDKMLIHLGQNMLGQSEKSQVELSGGKVKFESIDDGRDPDLPPPTETA